MSLQIITSGNTTVDQMMKFDLTVAGPGNFIPNAWYKSIHFENGKPYLIACNILAEIVYWYKPQVFYDEQTGQISSIKKKFKGELLQKSYNDLAENYGISKGQATIEPLFISGRSSTITAGYTPPL